MSGPALVIAGRADAAGCWPGPLGYRPSVNAGWMLSWNRPVFPPQGGTPLFTLVEHPQAAALHTALCRRHILTRRFDYAPTWLRLGLAPDEAGDVRLARALAESLREINGQAA